MGSPIYRTNRMLIDKMCDLIYGLLFVSNYGLDLEYSRLKSVDIWFSRSTLEMALPTGIDGPFGMDR